MKVGKLHLDQTNCSSHRAVKKKGKRTETEGKM